MRIIQCLQNTASYRFHSHFFYLLHDIQTIKEEKKITQNFDFRAVTFLCLNYSPNDKLWLVEQKHYDGKNQ